jgi:hypothetical protein
MLASNTKKHLVEHRLTYAPLLLRIYLFYIYLQVTRTLQLE